MAPKNDAAKAGSSSSSDAMSSSDEEGHQAEFEVRLSKSKSSVNNTIKPIIKPFAIPPSDASSGDYDSAEEGDDETRDKSGGGDEEDSSSDEDSESEDEKTTNLPPRQRPSKPASAPAPPSDSATDSPYNSDSGCDTSDEAPPNLVAGPSIKPVNSKVVDASLRPGNHAVSSLTPPSPPHTETDPSEKHNDSGRQKKQLFQRRWSLADEITLLKGLLVYSNEKGTVPTSAHDIEVFFDFIKGCIQMQVNHTQLYDKVRNLKRGFEKNLARPKSGADPTFSKSREQTLYELSKKVWGIKSTSEDDDDDDAVEAGDDNEESRRDIVRVKSQCPYVWEKVMEMADEYSCGVAIKRSLEMLDGIKAQQMERKLRKHGKTEMALNVRRSDMNKESVKLIVDAVSRAERESVKLITDAVSRAERSISN